MLVKLYDNNPDAKIVRQIVEILRNGGIIIYPTDTVYAMGCDINSVKAIGRVCALKGVKPEKSLFSMICRDLSNIANYAKVSNSIFKIMKRNLPGPFTFILPATSKLPSVLSSKRRSIGIRIPDNNILMAIVEELGNPILTTSIKSKDKVLEYLTDPELIHEEYEKLVDAVVDGGYGQNIASTIVDCQNDELEIIREGCGELIL